MVIVALAATLAVSLSHAASAHPMQVMATIPSTVVTDDGGPWAAWELDGRLVRLRDGNPPRSALPTPVLVGENCEVATAGAGLLALDCSDPTGPTPQIYRLHSAKHVPVAGRQALSDTLLAHGASGGFFKLSGVGRRLLAYDYMPAGPATPYVVYFDWRAGTTPGPFGILTPGAHEVVDLDRPSGVKPLCRPLRVPLVRASERPGDPRRRAAARLRESRLAYVDDEGALVLRRCGRQHAQILTAQADGDYVLTSRFVAWVSGRTVHVRTFGPSGGQRRWKAPAGAKVSAVQGTQRRLFVTAYAPGVRTYVFRVR